MQLRERPSSGTFLGIHCSNGTAESEAVLFIKSTALLIFDS
jgi:hypothetical protein